MGQIKNLWPNFIFFREGDTVDYKKNKGVFIKGYMKSNNFLVYGILKTNNSTIEFVDTINYTAMKHCRLVLIEKINV